MKKCTAAGGAGFEIMHDTGVEQQKSVTPTGGTARDFSEISDGRGLTFLLFSKRSNGTRSPAPEVLF